MTWRDHLRRRWNRLILGRPTYDFVTYQRLEQLRALVNERSHPNLNELSILSHRIDILSLNVKALGYRLAQDLAAALPPPGETAARRVGLGSKPSTQADIESDWVAHWCGELKVPVLYHRKLWELAYILQNLHDAGLLREGTRGLGFGVGTEPLASYFAKRGARVTVTDLDADDGRSGDWSGTGQHASGLLAAHHPRLVARKRFLERVDFRAVDMNAIPADLAGYDFCWSTCALEHLGSIEQGLAFIENSLRTLRPGGTAVHTTELNLNSDGPTIDNWPTVLFQRRHFEGLAARLEAAGHRVAPLDFDVGDQPLDRFVDIPPYGDGTLAALSDRLGDPAAIKVAIDGFVSTCFGIAVTKAG